MPLHHCSHPLAHALLTELRDKHTPASVFRALCHRLTIMLAIEATRGLPTQPRQVETPLELHDGVQLGVGVMVVPVLRAGLGMVEPILSLLPHAQVGHVGIERDHATALPRSYYAKIPKIENQQILVVDPMLATGGTALHAIASLKAAGGRHISVLSIIAAPEGVQAVLDCDPEIAIYAAAVDRCLNAQKYILPGVGDFGDRLMGT